MKIAGASPEGRNTRESWFALLRAGPCLGRMRVPVELAGSPLWALPLASPDVPGGCNP